MMNHYFFVSVKDTNQSIVSNLHIYPDDKSAIDMISSVRSVAEKLGHKILFLDIYKICGDVTERIYHE